MQRIAAEHFFHGITMLSNNVISNSEPTAATLQVHPKRKSLYPIALIALTLLKATLMWQGTVPTTEPSRDLENALPILPSLHLFNSLTVP